MPRYEVRFSTVACAIIEADDLWKAEQAVRAALTQYEEPTLLSIIQEGVVVVVEDGKPKPPTPFNRPPSGTPGGGKATTPPPLADLVAKTA